VKLISILAMTVYSRTPMIWSTMNSPELVSGTSFADLVGHILILNRKNSNIYRLYQYAKALKYAC